MKFLYTYNSIGISLRKSKRLYIEISYNLSRFAFRGLTYKRKNELLCVESLVLKFEHWRAMAQGRFW